MAQDRVEVAVHILAEQEAADKTGHRSAHRDSLPSSKLHLPMAPQASQIESSAGEQAFKTGACGGHFTVNT